MFFSYRPSLILSSVLQIIKVMVDGPPAVCSSSPKKVTGDFSSWYIAGNEAETTLLRLIFQHSSGVKKETSDPLPVDVLCDFCIDSPLKALKSCLTCQVSYCEAHLRPHLENDKFQNHRLVDPLHDVDCRVCGVHQLVLRCFCVKDCCCVCRDCEKEEHQGHPTISVVEARTQIEVTLQKMQEEINECASALPLFFSPSLSGFSQSTVQELIVIVEQQFARLQTAVEEARRGVAEVLEGEKRQALRQVEGIQAHLEQRRTESLVSFNKFLSRYLIHVFQDYSEWKRGISDLSLPTVHINRMDHLTSYVQEVTDAVEELIFLHNDKLGPKTMVTQSEPSSTPDPETREDFLQYARSVTFDPDTTHHFLRVMEDHRKLTNTSPWQHSYPDHPDRFECWHQALSLESLYQGRHYIEAELSGEGAHVGLTYKSIERKGESINGCITSNTFSWCVGHSSRGFSAWHAGLEITLEVTEVTRVGLFVDFDQGFVAIYNVTSEMALVHKFRADFLEPLYVATWLSKNNDVSLNLAVTPAPQLGSCPLTT
uniref:B30.2/SPRY domain-containing protein n=1 Tax=Mola mola TaxID=94237 RepID=A0A3Q3WI07_MOLML